VNGTRHTEGVEKLQCSPHSQKYVQQGYSKQSLFNCTRFWCHLRVNLSWLCEGNENTYLKSIICTRFPCIVALLTVVLSYCWRAVPVQTYRCLSTQMYIAKGSMHTPDWWLTFTRAFMYMYSNLFFFSSHFRLLIIIYGGNGRVRTINWKVPLVNC